MEHNQYILKKYLEQAVQRIRNVKKVGGKWQFFCSVCGDDVDHGNRNPRGALLLCDMGQTEKQWRYKCFNAGCECHDSTWSASYWLKIQHPDLYNDYSHEVFRDNISEKKFVPKEDVVEEKKRTVIKEYKFTSILKDGEVERVARDYCKSRKIPEHIWTNFKIGNDKTYSKRMIIPFLDKKGLMYYFQARSLFGENPKYKNPTDYPKHNGIYNIFGVDKKKDIVLCEGPIDSMFLPNAIAVTGASVPRELDLLLKDKKVLYLWDNDEAGWKKSKKCLQEGKNVFLWKKFLSDTKLNNVKDVNDVCLSMNVDKLEYNDLIPYFSNDLFNEIFI